MIPAVVVSLVLVTSTVALPLTTQQNPIGETPQIQTGIPLTIIPQQFEKTGTPTTSTQSEQYTPQGEKTGYQTPIQVQQNTAVPKVENVPVNVEEVQTVYTQNPVLLPVQPLSVVPFNPTGQVLRPIVVPAEAIADGRVIISPIGQIQQRNFQQDVFVAPETQLHQQVPQPTTYVAAQTQEVEPSQQTYYVQPVEKQTSVQSTTQGYPTQEQFNREQQIPTTNVVNQAVEPVQVQQTVPQQQVYSVQEPQQTQVYTGTPVVVDNVEKQTPYQQSTQYTETTNQHQYTPQTIEKQTEQQVTGYTPVQVAEKTEKQGYTQTQQQSVQTHPVQPVHQQQVYSVQPEHVEHQVPNQQQNVERVQAQGVKTTEVEVQQVAPAYNFGEKLPQVQQHVPVQTLSTVPQTQETSVQSSVSSTQ